MKIRLALLMALAAGGAHAQNTIYRCGNAYSDEPCPSAATVDIRPTDGAHSLSGTRRHSNEALMRDMHRSYDKAMQPLYGITPEEKARQREEARFRSVPRVKIEK